MKKIILLLGMLVSLLTISDVYASEVKVQLNGNLIEFSDTTAQIINDRTMVPFRKIFNELGVSDDNIEWEEKTRTIVATKNDTKIQLQIENLVAQKTIGGKTQEIMLDSAPVIRNDRTLVPLRFIAESLGKTVGWDAANQTAIIIDFDYFENQIQSKSSGIYEFIQHTSSERNVSITRKYFDESDSSQNNVATVNAHIIENQTASEIVQNVSIQFSGTNELMQDIAQEGWAEIQYENHYGKDSFTTKALNDGLKKVYGQEQMKFKYEALGYEGSNEDSFADLLKTLLGVKENTIRVETFSQCKEAYEDWLRLFQRNTEGSLTTGAITSDSIPQNCFDFTKLDNVLYNDSINRVYTFLNSQIFHFDVTAEELFYDYPRMNMTISGNSLELRIDFQLWNDYNERVEYIIMIKQ